MSRTMSSSTSSPPKSLLPLDVLFDNPVFAGGIGLAGLGAAAALARKSVIQGAALVKRRLLVDLEISKQDESYQYVDTSQFVKN
jgi:chaperone BCS1